MSEKRTAEQILKAQYKRQNDHIRENYDRVSIALPKGTKERINATGESMNAFIVNATLRALDACEGSAPEHKLTWDRLADLEKQRMEKEREELLNAPRVEPEKHGDLTKAIFYHGEVTKETDTSSETPDALKLQEELERKREQYRREKEAEQTQADAQKMRVFNPQDYK